MMNLKISQWGIITKLIVMNLLIFITVSCVVIINFLLSSQVEDTLTKVINDDVKNIINNAELSRDLNNIFSDIHLLTYTFINDEKIINNEGNRLLIELHSCMDKSIKSKLIYSDLEDFKVDLERLIKHYSSMIKTFDDLEVIENQLMTLIDTFYGTIANNIITKRQENKECELYLLELFNSEIPNYKNLLFQIKINLLSLKNSQFSIKQYNNEYEKEIFRYFNELMTYMESTKATDKNIEPLVNKIINTTVSYREKIKHLIKSINKFQELLEALNIKKIVAISKLQRSDNEISFSADKIGRDVIRNIQATNNLTFILSIVIIVILFVIQIYGIKLTKPIRDLTRSVSEISSGNLETPIDTSRNDELGILARNFMEMKESIKEKISALAEKNLDLEEEIKERKRLDKERTRLNRELIMKNDELEELIYITSHDLRSPLVNISGFSEELTLSINELKNNLEKSNLSASINKKIYSIMNDDILSATNYIRKSTFKMDQLLSGLLQLSRLGRSITNFSVIDMNKLIFDILQIFDYKIKTNKISIEVNTLPSCKGDFLQINQLFSNLIDNAIKYLKPNTEGLIKISGSKRKENVLYCIEDNGVGIPEKEKEKVFEIFHRVNPLETTGEGLGLSIIKKIAVMHNGKVWFEPKENGTKFFVSLPK